MTLLSTTRISNLGRGSRFGRISSRAWKIRKGENVGEIKDRLDELAKHNLNGREIRNALSTARQLASHGGEKLRWEHLELAIKTANDFGRYLRDVHGHSDSEWARETRMR